MSTADILRAARALIGDPAHWTQGEDARSASGEGVDPFDASATCYCAGGAVIRATGPYRPAREMDDALRALRAATGYTPCEDEPMVPDTAVYPWNDLEERTHADVLAALDRAIAAQEQN